MLMLLPLGGFAQLIQNHTDMTAGLKDNDPGTYRVLRTEDAWKRTLSDEQFYILRRAGTERPFTGKYVDEDRPGIYFSAATGQPLFIADAKFQSSCGWPSFFEPITPESVYYRTDNTHGMIRTEVVDSSSGSHLGHVFNDGPPPTGLRYCMNSAALIFVPLGEHVPDLVREYMEKLASNEERQAIAGKVNLNK